MKSNNFDLGFFEEYLKQKGLLDCTVNRYVKALSYFLKDDPIIDSIDSYNNFLVRVMVLPDKRGDIYYFVLKNYISFKFKNDYSTRSSLTTGLLKPRLRDPKTVRLNLSLNDRLRVINNIDSEKFRLVATLQAITGGRVGDILKIKQGSINEELIDNTRRLRIDMVGKGQRIKSSYIFEESIIDWTLDYIERECSIPEKSVLEKRLRPKMEEQYYFLNEWRKLKHTKFFKADCHVTEYNIFKTEYYKYWCALKDALIKSRIDLTKFATHDFRRCYAGDVFAKYNNIVILKTALHHADINTTARYLRYSGLDNISIAKDMQL